MALSEDLRERVVKAVIDEGMSRNAAAKRFGVGMASAARWAARLHARGGISPSPMAGTGGPSGLRFIAITCSAPRLATRYDKAVQSRRSFAHIAALRLSMCAFVNRT